MVVGQGIIVEQVYKY